MPQNSKSTTKYNWLSDIAPYLHTINHATSGFTTARRGVVTLADGTKVFVKISTDPEHQQWIKKEIKTYQILNAAGFQYTPQLLGYSDDYSAMAIESLDDYDFGNTWDSDKLAAAIRAQSALEKLRDAFADDVDYLCNEKCELLGEWPHILENGNIDIINAKLKKLDVDLSFTRQQILDFQSAHKDWHMDETTLIHLDLRADNFAYDAQSKSGKLIDWDWLCLGDTSLDTTGLFVSVFMSGYDPYTEYPEKYDSKMLIYLIGFWLTRVLDKDEDSSPSELKVRAFQAASVKTCMEILAKYGESII